MATKNNSYVKLLIDISLILVVGLGVLLLSLLGSPFHRGYYCQDTSIHFPYHESTISTLTAALCSLLIPIALFGVCEFVHKKSREPATGEISCGGRTPPRGVVRWMKLSGVFIFGAGVEQIITDIAKYTIGRLRPHFLNVCNPDIQCSFNSEIRYIENYICMSTDTARVDEARLSFPSGHASITFYGAVFTIMYLQCSLNVTISRLLRHFFQLLLILAAWFTALTRVTDYHHHWSDVLAGIFIGSLFASLTVMYLSDLRLEYSLSQRRDELAMISRDMENKVTPTTSSYAQQDSLQATELIA